MIPARVKNGLMTNVAYTQCAPLATWKQKAMRDIVIQQ